MKLSYILSLALAAVFAFAVSLAPAMDHALAKVASIPRMCAGVCDTFLEALGRGLFAAVHRSAPSAPAVMLVRARDMIRRTLKRETPRIESTFRLCPSV